MTEAERLEIERLFGLAERHRQRAEILSALGEILEASNCRVLASLQEERALRLERRTTAA